MVMAIAQRDKVQIQPSGVTASRCMSQIAEPEHKQAAGKLKNILATYQDAEDLIKTLDVLATAISELRMLAEKCSKG